MEHSIIFQQGMTPKMTAVIFVTMLDKAETSTVLPFQLSEVGKAGKADGSDEVSNKVMGVVLEEGLEGLCQVLGVIEDEGLEQRLDQALDQVSQKRRPNPLMTKIPTNPAAGMSLIQLPMEAGNIRTARLTASEVPASPLLMPTNNSCMRRCEGTTLEIDRGDPRNLKTIDDHHFDGFRAEMIQIHKLATKFSELPIDAFSKLDDQTKSLFVRFTHIVENIQLSKVQFWSSSQTSHSQSWMQPRRCAT